MAAMKSLLKLPNILIRRNKHRLYEKSTLTGAFFIIEWENIRFAKFMQDELSVKINYFCMIIYTI